MYRGPSGIWLGVVWSLALGIVVCGASSAAFPPAQAAPALVLLNTSDTPAMQQALSPAKALGAVVRHAFPPHVAVVELPAAAETALSGDARVDFITRQAVDPEAIPSGYGRAASDAVIAWNEVYVLPRSAAAESAFPTPLTGDARQVPPAVFARRKPAVPAPPGADQWQTSEYMMGSTTISLVFLESNGSIDPQTENWASLETSQVVSQCVAAMNWWVSVYPYSAAPLSFTWENHYEVPTGYEPIGRTSGDDSLWIAEALTALGHPSSPGDLWDALFGYNNALRNANNTDWAFTVFVVDSSNDVDGAFTDDYFAYAYINGPYVVLTYDNDGWGISAMDSVLAHEAGHIYAANDEYCDVGYSCCDPDEYSGYLRIQNTNCQRDPICLMNSNVWALCSVTRAQIGWRDSDADGIPDILDVAPTASLAPFTPDPVYDDAPTFTGSAAVRFYPNNSPRYDGPDVTLNRIAGVQYRIDGAPWLEAEAVDGAFDEPTEAYTFTPAPLDDGVHVFQARSLDTSGNFSPEPYPSDTLEIIAHAMEVIALADPLVVPSEGSLQLTGSALDLDGHAIISYEWDDGGAGGVFLPATTITGPAYAAPANETGADLSVSLTLSATCDGSPPKTKAATLDVTVTWDFDDDGMPDFWEQAHGFDPYSAADAALDADGDGLANLGEYEAGTNPGSGDTDADGLPDAWELQHGLNPLADGDASADEDSDSLNALGEYQHGSDPANRDTDADGFGDGEEVSLGSDPASAISQPTAGHFSDVRPTGYGPTGTSPFWAFHEIEACFRAGIVNGYLDGTYRPGLAVSRDQMAAYIARALAGGNANVPNDYTNSSFTDVTYGYWAFNYIEYAAERNVVRGYDDGSGGKYYAPGLPVDRGAMSAYVARSIVTPTGDDGSLPGPITPTFDDVPNQYWAYKQVEYCYREGVVKGYLDGLYHPEIVVSRDQMAMYIARAFDLPR